ncbi:bifunctional 4-hydroxy-2-oxoglutarate aldolase/2-dehydro-3-deoxy-phosphogluconate aldolase [Clostridium sp. YIM B02551]|uniref:bifunctional 4-hydroxy-2-oxoglutarate aldolase/2-dehydro-3-deoxy-phosphogluconate aldolase n=1 Tax=Clostridium sp. YIM B02551 TaxID=2910679 RepID=UPI001EE9CB0A
MKTQEEVLNSILNKKLVAVVRGENLEEGKNIITASKDAGITSIEITYTNKDASELIKHFINDEDLCVGAGTVTNIKIAKEAIESGATFIVGPNFDEEIAEYCNNKKVLYIPGCITPSEIIKAQKYKCSMVKIFPGDLVGPKFIKAIKTPIPNIKYMVTGGVNLENMEEWIKAGTDALGIGSVLTENTNLEYHNIVNKAKAFCNKIK